MECQNNTYAFKVPTIYSPFYEANILKMYHLLQFYFSAIFSFFLVSTFDRTRVPATNTLSRQWSH